MSLPRLISVLIALSGTAAAAEPLVDMQGSWRGTGWAREFPQGPQEALRCQVGNRYEEATLTLTLSGKCAVPGRKFTLSGKLIGTPDGERITGRWYNPDGIGSVGVTGVQRDGIVAFTFRAKDPETGRDLVQNVEWRVSDDTLRLRSTDRQNQSITMSDITFTR